MDSAVAFMNAFFTEGLATRAKLLVARVEMSQVVSEAEAHHREESRIRIPRSKRSFCEPANIPLVLRGARWDSPVCSVLLLSTTFD